MYKCEFLKFTCVRLSSRIDFANTIISFILLQVNSNESAAVLCPADFSSYTLEEQRDYVEQNPDQLSCYCDK